MATLDIAREIAQLRGTPGANWLAQALQKIADHINAPPPPQPQPKAEPPVTLASLLPPGTSLLTTPTSARPAPPTATLPVSGGYAIADLSNPDNQGSAPVSVGLAMPADFIVAGSPAQNNQTITVTRATETANTVLAGPASGAAAVPAYRALVAADVPAPAGDVTGAYAATTVTGMHFGTNSMPFVTTAPTSGDALVWNGTNVETAVLGVSGGGSGTATPALVAGSNITLSGSWPAQTVAVTEPPVFGDLDLNGSDAITEAPPGASVNTGWKARLYSQQYALGVAPATFCILAGYWASLFNGAGSLFPAGDGTPSSPDSNAVVTLGTNGTVWAATEVRVTGSSTNARAFTSYKTIGAALGPSFWFFDATGTISYGGVGLAGEAGNYTVDSAVGDVSLRSDSSGGWVRFSTNAGSSTQAALDNNGQFRFQFQTNAGEPATTPAIGNAVFDTTNNKLWVYTSAGWKGVALS